MRYKVKLLHAAYTDLREAEKWYKEKGEKLAGDFKTAIHKEINYIAKHPEQSPRKYKELRQSLVKHFPYAIFYLIEKESNRIVILGVLHTRRNPEIIQRRMKR